MDRETGHNVPKGDQDDVPLYLLQNQRLAQSQQSSTASLSGSTSSKLNRIPVSLDPNLAGSVDSYHTASSMSISNSPNMSYASAYFSPDSSMVDDRVPQGLLQKHSISNFGAQFEELVNAPVPRKNSSSNLIVPERGSSLQVLPLPVSLDRVTSGDLREGRETVEGHPISRRNRSPSPLMRQHKSYQDLRSHTQSTLSSSTPVSAVAGRDTNTQGTSLSGLLPYDHSSSGSSSSHSLRQSNNSVKAHSRSPSANKCELSRSLGSPVKQRSVDQQTQQPQSQPSLQSLNMNFSPSAISKSIQTLKSLPQLSNHPAEKPHLEVITPNSVPWPASDPKQWTNERVLMWLQASKYGPDWLRAFKQHGIQGEKFFSLVNYQNLRKLGNLSQKNENQDTSASRFIHSLRKILNRSQGPDPSPAPVSTISVGSLGSTNASSTASSSSQYRSTTSSSGMEFDYDNLTVNGATPSSRAPRPEVGANRIRPVPESLSPTKSAYGYTRGDSSPEAHDDDRDSTNGKLRSSGASSNSTSSKDRPIRRPVPSLNSPRPYSLYDQSTTTFGGNIKFTNNSTNITSNNNNSNNSLVRGQPVYMHQPQPSTPSSPSFRPFFRRHNKSNSSESSLLLSSSSSFNNFNPDEISYLSSTGGHHADAAGLYMLSTTSSTGCTDSRKGRGLLGKLRRKDHRSKSRDSRLESPTSPVFEMTGKKGSIGGGSVAETAAAIAAATAANSSGPTPTCPTTSVLDKCNIDPKYRPRRQTLCHSILVTLDNLSFSVLDVTEAPNVTEVKRSIAELLKISDGSHFTVHLTDFNSRWGEALEEGTLHDLLRYSGGEEVLKFYIDYKAPTRLPLSVDIPATTSNVKPLSSPTASSTPSPYTQGSSSKTLTSIGATTAVGEDGGSDTPLAPMVNAEGSDNEQESSVEASSVTSSSQVNGHGSSSQTNHSNSSNDSFKVIRSTKREINFDDRRSSPYERKPSLVAMRSAPPPPLGRQSSIKVKVTVSTESLSPMPAPTPGDNKGYSPGQTENLIPLPYVGRQNAVVRKPVRKVPVKKTSTSTIASRTSSTKSIKSRSEEQFCAIPSSSFLAVQEKEKEREREKESQSSAFVENTISFEDAPAFEDDSDSDDDGANLWAKAPKLQPPSEQNGTTPSQSVPNVSKRGFEDNSSSSLETKGSSKGAEKVSPVKVSGANGDQWVVRPPTEVVYDNLERFFPNADLDKPIIDDPLLSPVQEPTPTPTSQSTSTEDTNPVVQESQRPFSLVSAKCENEESYRDPDSLVVAYRGSTDGKKLAGKRVSRLKSLRIVAREASEARKRQSQQAAARAASIGNAPGANKADGLLRRKSTKMWGQRVVEMTPNEIKQGNLSLLRDQKGQFQKFIWVKGELIGKGTFGKVYLALNATTGEMMAVKQVEVPQTASDRASARQREVIDALHSEVETLKDLDHLNIVQYLGFEALDDVYNLFLEYVPGGSVGRVLHMYGRFEEPIIRHLTYQILDGLSYLHSCNILHRDLKADNLLIDLDGVCKISDFGISKKSRDIYANDAEMSMQGTIFWMAPEVIHNVVHNEKQGYSAKIDVWSLGCVLLEMFAGRRPWSTDEAIGAMYKLGTSRQAPPLPEDTKPFVSAEGNNFLDLCFTIDGNKRPTAQELRKHNFCTLSPGFDFSTTMLAKAIRFNSKTTVAERKWQPIPRR